MYFELQHHAPQLKKVIDNQHSRLRELEQKLSEVERQKGKIADRIDRAVELHGCLEERLQSLRRLPGSHKKPLSKAEKDFKFELGKISTESYFKLLFSRLLNEWSQKNKYCELPLDCLYFKGSG